MLVSRLPLSLTAAALLAAGAAHAADYSQPAPQCYDAAFIASGRAPPGAVPCYVPAPVIEEFGGWYLRGDIGFSNQSARNFYVGDTDTPGVQHVDKGFDAAPLFGVGVGYYFNDWLRFDVTGEYRGKANFHAFDVAPNGGGLIDDRYSASKSEWTFLLNGYVDLGTWYNVTPFVGAGIGFSRNTISNFGDIAACTNSSSCAASGGADAFASEASKWNFAWALHAGLAYKVSKNFTVELAYRYIDLGDAETGLATAFDGSGTFGQAHFKHLTSQDIKLGVRFNLDGLADCCARPAPYYAPQPTYVAPPIYAPQPPVYQQPLRSKG